VAERVVDHLEPVEIAEQDRERVRVPFQPGQSLREAVKQARAAAGPDAALRVLAVDPDSRVPERRAVLTPFE